MLNRLMTALLAAAAFVPTAQAQEGDGRDGRDAGISRRGELARMRERAADEGERPHFRRREEAQQAPAFRPQPQRAPDQPRATFQPQAEAQTELRQQPARRSRGERAERAERGGMFAERRAREAQQDQQNQQRQQLQQLEQQQDGWRRRDRGQGFAGGAPQAEWRRADPGRTPPFSAEQRRDDGPHGDANRRFDDQRRWGDARRRDDRQWTGGRRYEAPNYAWNGRNDWSRRWRDDNRYDWGRYRQQNRNLFRLPRYYAPYDWTYGYRRFSIGVTLSSLLWSQDYWIDDPSYYRLPPAYGPYRWVRYYNDALLVDIRTGYVVDTVYDIFW